MMCLEFTEPPNHSNESSLLNETWTLSTSVAEPTAPKVRPFNSLLVSKASPETRYEDISGNPNYHSDHFHRISLGLD